MEPGRMEGVDDDGSTFGGGFHRFISFGSNPDGLVDSNAGDGVLTGGFHRLGSSMAKSDMELGLAWTGGAAADAGGFHRFGSACEKSDSSGLRTCSSRPLQLLSCSVGRDSLSDVCETTEELATDADSSKGGLSGNEFRV